MIVLGDPQKFAVGLELSTTDPAPQWMYGKFALWVCGREIGDPACEVTLSDVLVSSDSWLPNDHSRRNDSLLSVDKVTAFLSIDAQKYGFEHLARFIPDSFRPIPISEQSNFEIHAGDAFDDCKLYCVEGDSNNRLLYSLRSGGPDEITGDQPNRAWSSPEECWVPRAEFTDVMARASGLLRECYESHARGDTLVTGALGNT